MIQLVPSQPTGSSRCSHRISEATNHKSYRIKDWWGWWAYGKLVFMRMAPEDVCITNYQYRK